ncbi:MAG: hypothetical protein Q9208_006772 [Pyrenodesmia sp. 3 TL-2023]
MSAMHILALPNEILGMISSSLPVKALLNLSLVCKHFCTLAQPIIFHSISIHTLPIARSSSSRLSKVVSALTENPTLRGNVEALSLWTLSHTEKLEDQNALISLLPRLKFLQLQPPPAELDLSGNPLLETLDLDFDGFGDLYHAQNRICHASSMKVLSKLLWHPALRSLSASCVDLPEPDEGRFFAQERFATSPINCVSLKVYDADTIGALPQLLKSFKALQSFTLETICNYQDEDLIEQGMAPQSIGLALSDHTITLVDLIISSVNGAEFAETSLFGSLAQFRCLKRLGIPETFLASHEDERFDHPLPPNLSCLQLQYSMGSDPGHDEKRPQRIQRLRCLLTDKDLNVPLLKDLIWWYEQPECWTGITYGPETDIFELGEMFRCEGVRFQHKIATYYMDTPLAGARPSE